MMDPTSTNATLRGIRVAILEARMGGELESIVRRWGGEPYGVPAVREATCSAGAEVDALLDESERALIAGEPPPIVVLSTGAGALALLEEAAALGRLDAMRALLARAVTVCRGPKPIAALKSAGLPIGVRVREPYTTSEVIEALDGLDLFGRRVVLVHYGERNAALVNALARGRVRATELLLYAWQLPEDTSALSRLVEEIIERRVGAIAFTSQVQARHLFAVGRARATNAHADLVQSLRSHTIVAAVGPTCARALESFGVTPHVVPAHPKMGAMVAALARHVSRGARSVA